MYELTIDQLQRLPLFENLSERTLEAIISLGHLQCYSANTPIFHDRDTLSCTYILLSGTASLYKTHSSGQNKMIFMLNDGALLNEMIASPLPSSINCKAYSNCHVLLLYNSDLLRLMEDDFILAQNFMNALSKRIRRLYRQLKNSTSVIKMEKKLAAKLWKLSKDYGVPCDEGILIDLPITITSLAELLGSYRETVSRSIKLLTHEGLIIYKNKKVIIPNPEQLSIFFKSNT